MFRTKSSKLLYQTLLRILITYWLVSRERGNGQNNTQANAVSDKSFKPEERFKCLNFDRLGLVNNTKSSQNTQTHLSALKG